MIFCQMFAGSCPGAYAKFSKRFYLSRHNQKDIVQLNSWTPFVKLNAVFLHECDRHASHIQISYYNGLHWTVTNLHSCTDICDLFLNSAGCRCPRRFCSIVIFSSNLEASQTFVHFHAAHTLLSKQFLQICIGLWTGITKTTFFAMPIPMITLYLSSFQALSRSVHAQRHSRWICTKGPYSAGFSVVTKAEVRILINQA